MLRQLKIRNELKILYVEQEKTREKTKGYEKRKKDLEASLEEASSEEDLQFLRSEIEKLEVEINTEDVGEKEKTIENEIKKLETELEELDKKAEEEKEGEKEETAEDREKKGGYAVRKHYIFGEMTREQQQELVRREEVKNFLEQVRNMKGQRRSIQGAELTIPEIVLDLLKDNLHRYSKLITKVQLKPLAGHARQHIMGAIPEAVWMEAIGTLNELNFSINQIEVDGYKVGGFIPISNSTLEDSDINMTAEIIDALGQSIGIAVDKAILYGTGQKMPLGIATRLAQTTKPSDWAANAPEWVDLHAKNVIKYDGDTLTGSKFFEKLILNTGLAKANYSNHTKIWCMNSTTKTIVLSKALTFNAAGALVAGVDNTMPVIGGEIIELEFIPDGDIFFCYSSLYLLAERAGGTFGVSDQVRFIEDQTVFKGTARYDGKPVIGSAFLLINIKNTDATTSLEFAEDRANTPSEPDTPTA